MEHDTIAAISTFPGESGIGIIRISGNDAIDIADKLYIDKNGSHSLHTYKSHTIHYGFLTDTQEKIIDEVMISIMKSPNSYTKEDVIEINCHGGIRICKTILETVINAGARIADPGEFTKRAFLNGRLDLTRAEAVMDAIRANSDMALTSSINHIRGSLYNKLNNICSVLLYEIAFIESALDDPDSISTEGYSSKLYEKIDDISKDINKLIKSYDEGKIISEGINTVIIGKPNAGKSSLLNALMDEDRAIVTDIPGTTRDILTEKIRLGQIVLNITDTAGIRETEDLVENIGVNKAKEEINKSDLVLYICDSSSSITDEDKNIIPLLSNKTVIVILNKDDLDTVTTKKDIVALLEKENVYPKEIISSSMKNKNGIEELKNKITDLFLDGDIISNDDIIITNMRHVEQLKNALISLQKVKESIDMDMPEDFYSIDLTDAYSALAKITGAEVSEDIVNEIFSKFCMGK